jgi:uncharacterized membrane protein
MKRPRLSPADDNGDLDVRQLRTARLEAFSDGVFAIAITLLVLEISMPEDDPIGDGLLSLWPSYVAYMTSFLTIGGIWLSHTLMTEHLRTTDAILMRLNLAVLLFVSFLPFPTRLLAETMNDTEDARVAAPFYGAILLVLGVLLAAMWRYSVSAGLIRSDTADEDIAALTQRLSPAVLLYLVAIVIGLLLPRLAPLLYISIAIFVLVPIASGYRRTRVAEAASE